MKNWDGPTLFEVNRTKEVKGQRLQDKGETPKRMKLSSGKPKIEDSNPPTNVTRTKIGAKIFASTSSSQTPPMGDKDNGPTSCIACKEKHRLWRCPVFREKTPTQQTKLVADNELCFSCLNGQHLLHRLPKPRKCLMQGCPSTHKTLLYGSGRIFSHKNLKKTDQTMETTASNVTVVTNKTEESPGMPFVTNVKGLIQITEVSFQPSFHTERVLILCDFACSNLRIFRKTGWKIECPRHIFGTYSSRDYPHLKPLTRKLSS